MTHAWCERIARICVKMSDPTEAGRWYLLADSSDAESQPCIDRFLSRFGRQPNQAMSQFPMSLRFEKLTDYPPTVASRLQAIGNRGQPRSIRGSQSPRTLKARLAMLASILVVIWVIGVFVIGLLTLGRLIVVK
ncbi:hypothetical protein ANRL2_00172 [Anaerolineae bacterium]|nr:hypothetical protein ANRL2_00172 [Anaerolineae bacterium]